MFTKHPRHPCQSQVKDGKDSMQQPPNFAVAYHVKRFVVAQSLTVCLETSMYLETERMARHCVKISGSCPALLPETLSMFTKEHQDIAGRTMKNVSIAALTHSLSLGVRV